MKFMTNEIKPKIIQNYNSKMFLTKGELVKNCQVFLNERKKSKLQNLMSKTKLIARTSIQLLTLLK